MASQLKQLSLETLGEMGLGITSKMLEKHIRRAAVDCNERPSDASPRRVTLELQFSPVANAEDGSCELVEVACVCKSKVPDHKTRRFSMKVKANGMLLFNPDSPENPNQSTMLPDPPRDDD
jgi:hypothetical protein